MPNVNMLTDIGAKAILAAYFESGRNHKLKLFSNDATLTADSVVGDLTEVSGGGYTPGGTDLLGANFVVDIVGGIAQAAYSQKQFTFTGTIDGSGIVYGYYVTNAAGTELIFAEKTAVPFTPSNNGDAVLVTPIFKLSYGTVA